jgi:hypothetical protein
MRVHPVKKNSSTGAAEKKIEKLRRFYWKVEALS